jgi:hypothetical protein
VTVAVCILAATPEEALRLVEGVPNVRRLVDAAWAGGALPIVVIAPESDGAVAAVLSGSPATLETAPARPDTTEQVRRAMAIARREVAGTTALLVWPGTHGWIDAATITALIELHGADRGVVIRPGFDAVAGWPLLLPINAAPGGPEAIPDDLAAVPARVVDLGDPGATHSLEVCRADLPPFEGLPPTT